MATLESAKKRDTWHGYGFDAKCVKVFNDFCDSFDSVKVVISSSWRGMFKSGNLEKIFKEQGVKHDIYDITPISLSHRNRGQEIQEWLDENNKDNEGYIVIDDEVSDINPYIPQDKIIHIDQGWSEGGLKKGHIKK